MSPPRRTRSFTHALRACAAAAICAVALAACCGSGGSTGAAATGAGRGVGAGTGAGAAGAGGRVVPVRVGTNPKGAVVVLAPVYIDGKGPFAFVVDTGASRSVIDQKLAQKLGFHITRSQAQLTGVNATHAAGRIQVARWRIGNVQLPAQPVLTLPLASDQRGQGHPLGGLIGSDNLSRFGAFLLDYRAGRLVLGP